MSLLTIETLHAHYGKIHALKGISLTVNEGEIVCLIGANGAGKTTLLNCISGVHPDRRGKISFSGKDVTRSKSQDLVKMGIVQVPENRQLFGPLSVEENLEMGAYLRAGGITKQSFRSEMEAIFDLQFLFLML